jgi:hypothetical protein
MVIGIGLGVFLCGKWRVYEAVTAEVVTDFFSPQLNRVREPP